MRANGGEALHFGQAIWSRQWWLIYTLFFGAIGEYPCETQASSC
jgi:hypothetical protein